jgi:hypothetical protein
MSLNNTEKTTTNPTGGINVDLVGICSGDRGRSCDEHSVCGSVVTKGMVLKLKLVVIIVEKNKKEEAAIAAYRIGEDGEDLCRVGFLPRFAAKRPKQFAGKRIKVLDVFAEDDDSPVRRARYHKNRGFAIAEIIDDKQQSDVESKRKIADFQEDTIKKQKKEDVAGNE